ncbi:hypothetical protein LAZ67_18001814 [Cordylochernes scorpioides]|uniref:DDE-1 domain-containing protein n=1 Tax=Cordylochernes scorpioides TaxID=51811 RepID=A0ABY6LGZ7_9ARAC|nr:hypothetical protein LAZ67_18001814 [Cordylochernes scorpioides]
MGPVKKYVERELGKKKDIITMEAKREMIEKHERGMRAKALYAELGSKIPCTSIENEVHADFKASKGWFENFKRRSGIHSVTRHGEGASSDAEAAETFTAEFEKLVVTECYLPQQVFNCDETGLFWKKMPKRTYITAEANTMPGHKPMKDRLTLLLCANASRDLKVKPLLVYHSENPRAFKKHKVQKSQLNVLWKSNTKAWVTRLLFVEWINEAFGPAVKKYLSEKKLPLRALLVMDNAPAHPPSLKDHLLDEFKFIEVRFLPPNTTPLLQPMDQQLVEEEDQELTTNELIDLHREQHQEVKEVISSGEEEDENSLGSLPSDQIREICKMWETSISQKKANGQRTMDEDGEHYVNASEVPATFIRPSLANLVNRLTEALQEVTASRAYASPMTPYDRTYLAENFFWQLKAVQDDIGYASARLHELLKERRPKSFKTRVPRPDNQGKTASLQLHWTSVSGTPTEDNTQRRLNTHSPLE